MAAPRIGLAVILGSTREGRFSEKVAAWVTAQLGDRADVDVDMIDLRDHPLPMFDVPAPARTPREGPTTGPGRRAVRRWRVGPDTFVGDGANDERPHAGRPSAPGPPSPGPPEPRRANRLQT